MLEDISHQCPIIKDLFRGCFGGLSAQGSTNTVFNLLLGQRHVVKTGISLSGSGSMTQVSKIKVYQQLWKELTEWCA